MNLKKLPFDLQLFDDGEGAAPAGAEAAEGAAAEAPDKAALFLELVNGEYKEEAGKYVNSIVRKRTAPGRAAQTRLNELAPALEYLAQIYGLPIDSPELVSRIVGDKSLLADRALKNGRDEDTEYAITQANMRTERANQILASVIAQQDAQRWEAEAQALRQEFPGFDLDTELENPMFRKLLSDRSYNLDLRSAYMALHGNDVISYVAQQAQTKANAAVASGQNRPKENGAASRTPGKTSVDPMKMSKAEFKAMEEAVLRGERVSFG